MSGAYVPLLKSQHLQIQQLVNLSSDEWNQGHLINALMSLENLQSSLAEHHQVEKNILFENLKGLPKMNQGGPFCSYFFEFFMNNRPLLIAESLLSERRKAEAKLSIPHSLDSFFSSNSLLTIPLEEHLACEAICEELIESIRVYDPKNKEWISKAFQFLTDLLSTNHLKEESCLWVAAQQALEPTLYTRLSALSAWPEAV